MRYPQKMLRKSLALALFCVFSCSAQEVWNAPAFSLDAQAILRAAASKKSPADADVFILSDIVSYTFDAQGRQTTRIHRIYQVKNADGMENWGTTSSRWEPWHEEKPKLRARVIAPNGTVTTLDQKTVAEVPAEEGNETLSDARVLKAPLPGLSPGAIVEEEIIGVETTPLFAAGTVIRTTIGASQPGDHFQLVVDAPASLPLKYVARLLPTLDTKRVEERGRVRVTFTHGPMDALETRWGYLPYDEPRVPHVTISTASSWTAIGTAYHAIVEAQLRNAQLGPLTPGPTQPGQSRLEIANGLLRKLNEEIRYTGLEFAEAAIVPRKPAEVLARKYGDCKDQAALLVAMLRAAGIPANVALLRSGYGHDIELDLPGMGMFDHAIVYVPGTPGMWADPTDTFSRFNELPVGDQGRMALIASEAPVLLKIPESAAGENGRVETREFFLSEKGKSRVLETLETRGSEERYYRDNYDSVEDKTVKETLGKYVKDVFLSELPPVFGYTKSSDLLTPFVLRLEVNEAGRGATDETDGVVAIPLAGLLNQLPDMFLEKDEEAQQLHPDRKSDVYLADPVVREWRYKIHTPAGFRLTTLPVEARKPIGSGEFSVRFEGERDGIVSGVLRLDPGKHRYTIEEARGIRKAIEELQKEPMMMVRFEQTGEALLTAGKIKEAIAEFRRLAAMHPKEALHRTQVAKALLQAGAGDAAREEALEATKIEPDSAVAFAALGWVLEHDNIGRRFRKSSDLAGAEAAYRKAISLDAENVNYKVSLALILESFSGERYADKGRLDQAIAEYKALDGKLGNGFENNILYALLHARRYDEVMQMAEKRDTQTGKALWLAAMAAKSGGPATIAEAAKRVSPDSARRATLREAGQILLNLRFYKESADLLEAFAEGGAQAAAMRTTTLALRKTILHEENLKEPATPVAALKRFFSVMVNPNAKVADFTNLLVAGSPLLKGKEFDEVQAAGSIMRGATAKTGLSWQVTTDLGLASAQFSEDGSDEVAWRVRAVFPGQGPVTNSTAFVTKEEGKHRIITVDEPWPLADRSFQLLEQGNTAAAKQLLDWIRDVVPGTSNDDPLAGNVFAKLWTRDTEPTPTAMRNAAASLMGGDLLKSKGIAILQESRKNAKSDADKLNLDWALLRAYDAIEDSKAAGLLARELFNTYPSSDVALLAAVGSLITEKSYDLARELVDARLKRRADDVLGLRLSSDLYIMKGSVEQAIETGRKAASAPGAGAMEWNSLAWNMLVAGQATEAAIEAGQKAVTASGSGQFATLHTLAAIYAEANQLTEARQLLLQAVDTTVSAEPEDNAWYVLGRIAENYGITSTALAAYRRVEKPKDSDASDIVSSWALAQKRLAAMQAAK